MFDGNYRHLAASALPLLARLAGAADLATFWDGLIGLLRAEVPHHTAIVWCNYSVTVFGEQGAMDNDAGQVHNGTYFLTAQHLLHHAGKSTPREAEALTPAQLRTSADYFCQHIEPSGWEYALVLPFWQGNFFRASVALYRTASQGEFDPDEVANVRTQQSVFESALLRLLDQQKQRAIHSNVVDFLRDLPVGIIMLNWELETVFVNGEGYKQTQLWNHAPELPPRIEPKDNFRLPDDLRKICIGIRNKWRSALFGAQPLGIEFVEQVEHPQRADLKASISVSHLREDISQPPNFLIRYSGMASRVDQTFQPTRAQLSILAQLTPTERTVTMLTIRGMSNQEIAQELHREISTVKDHLSHIFDKLGIRSRSQLTSLLTQ